MSEGPQAQPGIVRFGEFELDLSRQTLALRGVRTKLQKQPFQVLKLLIQRAPEIVSRDDIRRQVWGDAVYIDAKQSINFCIRQIRSALGDISVAPRFIETLPRQGYRFIGPVEIPANNGISEHQLAPEPQPKLVLAHHPKIETRRWLIPGLAALVALAVIVGVWGWFAKRDSLSIVARIMPVTAYPGDEREPSPLMAVRSHFPGVARGETTAIFTLRC